MMPVHNTDIAAIFDEIADLLEIEGANRFRVRAYRNAARTLRDLDRDIAAMIAEGGDITELPGMNPFQELWLICSTQYFSREEDVYG
jgi:DNA polymerase (family 10)